MATAVRAASPRQYPKPSQAAGSTTDPLSPRRHSVRPSAGRRHRAHRAPPAAHGCTVDMTSDVGRKDFQRAAHEAHDAVGVTAAPRPATAPHRSREPVEHRLGCRRQRRWCRGQRRWPASPNRHGPHCPALSRRHEAGDALGLRCRMNRWAGPQGPRRPSKRPVAAVRPVRTASRRPAPSQCRRTLPPARPERAPTGGPAR